MTLREGLPLLYQQFTALFKKNLLLSWRNKRATCLQLFSSFFLILVIFCIQEAMEASDESSASHTSVTDPMALVSPPIPPCEDKFFVKRPCFDFVWSGNQSRRVTDIVSAIMANNPGRPIPREKVFILFCFYFFVNFDFFFIRYFGFAIPSYCYGKKFMKIKNRHLFLLKKKFGWVFTL